MAGKITKDEFALLKEIDELLFKLDNEPYDQIKQQGDDRLPVSGHNYVFNANRLCDRCKVWYYTYDYDNIIQLNELSHTLNKYLTYIENAENQNKLLKLMREANVQIQSDISNILDRIKQMRYSKFFGD